MPWTPCQIAAFAAGSQLRLLWWDRVLENGEFCYRECDLVLACALVQDSVLDCKCLSVHAGFLECDTTKLAELVHSETAAELSITFGHGAPVI